MQKLFAKLISIVFIILTIVTVFNGCTTKKYTPVIANEFTQNATIKNGEFTYKCSIIKTENTVTVIPTNTAAKGTKIIYDGKDVTFIKDDKKSTMSGDLLDKSNPSIALYQVFDYIKNTDYLNVNKTDFGYKYTGKTSLGQFVLMQYDNNTFDSLTFTNANITIKFDP